MNGSVISCLDCNTKRPLCVYRFFVVVWLIYELLSSHFSENDDASVDNHLDNSEEYEDVSMTFQKQVV